MGKLIDLTGQRFGRLTVVHKVPNKRYGVPRWFCKCDCGGTTEADSGNLKNGYRASCGCLSIDHLARLKTGLHASHRMSRTAIYATWIQIRERCENPKNPSYHRYGGRGIKVCERWQTFENFRDDMGEKPSKDHSIDRMDNDGNYEPDNCRWATRLEQTWNTRRNRYFELNGENLILSEWARRLGTSTDTIDMRLKAGWPLEKALTHPVMPKPRKSAKS